MCFLDIYPACWTCDLVSIINLGKFSAIITSNISSALFFLFLVLNLCMLPLLKLSPVPGCSFYYYYYFLCISVLGVSFYLLSSLLILFLAMSNQVCSPLYSCTFLDLCQVKSYFENEVLEVNWEEWWLFGRVCKEDGRGCWQHQLPWGLHGEWTLNVQWHHSQQECSFR